MTDGFYLDCDEIDDEPICPECHRLIYTDGHDRQCSSYDEELDAREEETT